MDQQLPLSEAAPYSPLGANDQACNECKRRKGKCDKVLPECGPCARNKRHCLYERNAKTPLTRKHLTAVEERLRQTEIRLRQAEARAKLAQTKLQEALAQQGTGSQSESVNEISRPTQIGNVAAEDGSIHGLNPIATFPNVVFQPVETVNADWGHVGALPQESQSIGFNSQDYRLEEPPSTGDDFSWDEQSTTSPLSPRQSLGPDDLEETSVTDGMASLSVEDRGTGYLGVASGAAMLRLLLPDAQHRRFLRPRSRDIPKSAPVVIQEGSRIPTPLYTERKIAEIDLDAAINAYFNCYHLAYPIIHEPTFRAQYAQIIPRPSGKTWNALAYMIGAMGLYTTAKSPSSQDVDLFDAAKSNMSIDSLESGNLELVQVLALMSNYLQKRNKPNSGYNYLGLALHVAMGLGLHKEFSGWQIAPLAMEIRRRVWWTLYSFFSGATITFGRPVSWPSHGVEVALPLNIDDRDLTHASTVLPPSRPGLTTHSAVAIQARLHLATNDIYERVISPRSPSAQELLQLDDERIVPWKAQWYGTELEVSDRQALPRKLTEWRCANFRIIMYRPFLIKQVFRERNGLPNAAPDSPTQTAIDRCLAEAAWTIASVRDFWETRERHVMSAWYCLYFMFQAALIPVIMLRNNPTSERSDEWRQQIEALLRVTESMGPTNPAAKDCHTVILRLCNDYLVSVVDGVATGSNGLLVQPVDESPQTQLSSVYSMMWPESADLDNLITDDSWMEFISDLPADLALDSDPNAFNTG